MVFARRRFVVGVDRKQGDVLRAGLHVLQGRNIGLLWKRLRRRIADAYGAGRLGRWTSAVNDVDGDLGGLLGGVLVRSNDVEAAVTGLADQAVGAAAVSPVDGGCEIARCAVRIAIRDRGHR